LLALGCVGAALGLGAGTALAQEYFGAIAYSPTTRAHGWSYDYGSRRDAERRARDQCGRHARDCEVPVWFRNACGALAVGADGYGSGWGATRKAAEGSAIRSCARFSGGCAVVRWVCTSR
jgi:serine/threonine-protein kinase